MKEHGVAIIKKTTKLNNSSTLREGTILRGIYRIEKQLTTGGFGNTYIAINTEFEERVAIKEFFIKYVKGLVHDI